jgi:hypothetical protein
MTMGSKPRRSALGRVALGLCLMALGVVGLGVTPVGVSAAAGPVWRIVASPNPTGVSEDYFYYLNGVSCTSAKSCSAVGYYDASAREVTLAERWNGNKWLVTPTPNPSESPNNRLLAVSCTSAKACTAVGWYSSERHLALAERWNGKKWAIEHAVTPSDSILAILSGVSCSSSKRCTAVGSSTDSDGNETTLAEVWNGKKWAREDSANRGDSGLLAVSCTAAKACTAVGDHVEGEAGRGSAGTLAEAWNGKKWEIQSTPELSGTTAAGPPLTGVSCTSPKECTAVGYYQVKSGADEMLAEHWNGKTWREARADNLIGTKDGVLSGVSCTSANRCTAVGENVDGTQTDDLTYSENWNGEKWTAKSVPEPADPGGIDLYAVSCTTAAKACTLDGYFNSGAGDQVALIERLS